MNNAALQVLASGSKKAISLVKDNKTMKKRRLIIGFIFLLIAGITIAKYWRWYRALRLLRLI